MMSSAFVHIQAAVQGKKVLTITNAKKSESSKANVVLFPKTYDYYQLELTRLLEAERYKDAVQLLSFLLQFEGEQREIREEWNSLYHWLLQAFPDLREVEATVTSTIHTEQDHKDDDEAELSESDLMRQQLAKKQMLDEEYIERLLQSLKEPPLDERKWMVLEQLALADSETLTDDLIHYLETEELHPLLRFGLLTTLVKRGAKGKVTYWHGAEQIVVQIEDTPLDYPSFPASLRAPAELLYESMSVRDPSLTYFAQEIWQQFVKAIYGTKLYMQMRDVAEPSVAIWAAALHSLVSRLLQLDTEDVFRIYGLSPEDRMDYERGILRISNAMIED